MKINAIQYIRAIAALLVVYTHCLNFIGDGNSYQANFYFLKNFGAIGVDLFFIISGFIITYVSSDLNGKQDCIEFVKKRFVRINPSYYFASMAALILRYLSHPHTVFPFREVVTSITIIPFFDLGMETSIPILHVGWTLAYEWFFYILFALLIFFSIKNKSLLLVLILGLLTFMGLTYKVNSSMYFLITNPILWEFCIGVFIAELYKKFKIPKMISFAILASGLLFYFLIIKDGHIVHLNGTHDSNGYWNRLLIWGLPSALIVFGLVFLDKEKVYSFNNKVILLIGNASFAIYLIHTIILRFISKIFHFIEFIPLDLIIVFTLLGSTITGILYYNLIEKKLVLFFSKILTSKNRIKTIDL